MEAEVGDTLTFEWPGVHNVYQMPSLEAFESCDFSSATLIGSETGVQATLDSLPAYFACEISGHCLAGQKLAVTAIEPTGKSHIFISDEDGDLKSFLFDQIAAVGPELQSGVMCSQKKCVNHLDLC